MRPYIRSSGACALSGFTLIEIIISVIILAIAGMSAYTGVMSSVRSRMLSQDRSQANTLMQETIEQLKANIAVSGIFFDTMSSTVFTVNGFAGYPDGYFQVHRTLVQSGVDLKRLEINVRWNDENGAARDVSQVISLSRPTQAQYGNIRGSVKRADNTSIALPGATVMVIQGDPNTTSTLTNASGLFTFLDSSGQMALPVGQNYRLRVTCPDYVPFETPEGSPLTVSENTDTLVPPVLLQRVYTSAVIKGSFLGPAHPMNERVHLSLCQSGTVKSTFSKPHWAPYEFKIDFPGGHPPNTPLCFTLATGLINYGLLFPYFTADDYTWTPFSRWTYCGRWDYRGWSSAVSAHPSSGWWGGPDDVCVVPGQTLVVDIPLVMAPVTQVNVTVKGDLDGIAPLDPIGGAMISVFDSQTQPVDWQERTANANGYAELPGVPAVSDLFPAGTDYKMFVRATKTFSVTQGCCNAVSSFTREVTQQLTGLTGMTGGGIVNVTLVMPDVAAVTCGSLHGTVRSLLDNTVINGADVAIGTMSVRTTDMSGHYVITCNACSSCVKPAQAGFHDFQISKQGYYPKTQGNNWPYVNISQVEVVSNQSNMRDEKLFPRTFSTVNVTVFEGTALNPGPVIPGVMVNYYQYGSAPALEQVQTDSNGNAFFSNVIETWPPLGLTTQQLIDKGLSHYWEVHKFEALEQSGYKAENEANKNNWVVVHGTAVQVNLYLTKVPTT